MKRQTSFGSFGILLTVLAISFAFFFVAAYACHGPRIFDSVENLDTTSAFDNIGITLDVNLSDKGITVVAPITSYDSTYTNYTHPIPPEKVQQDYEGEEVYSVVVDNAVYSFEAVSSSRLDLDGNGKMDVYSVTLPGELDTYYYFLVVPIGDMGDIIGETQYLSDAIIYALNECYTCE